MKIKGLYHVQQVDMDVFNSELMKIIKLMQEDGQVAEVQYKTHLLDNGQCVYQALLLGRVEDKDNEKKWNYQRVRQ